MRPWQFSKPKGPGFGISVTYYLSVLCSRATLPSILELVNPAASAGAIAGMGVPLASGADRTALQLPMSRGIYAIATKDRKTVLKMLILGPEEAGFDPETFARSSMALDADADLVARVRGAWNLAQFTFESHDPAVYPAVDFMLSVVARLASMSDGVVADPVSQRYLLPEQVFNVPRVDPRVDARDHVTVRFRVRPDGLHAFTLGLQKFNLPEHEILNLFDEDQGLAEAFLMALAQRILIGDLTRPGEQFGAPRMALEAREGGFDLGLWEGTPVFELLPPTSHTAGEALRAWAREAGISF